MIKGAMRKETGRKCGLVRPVAHPRGGGAHHRPRRRTAARRPRLRGRRPDAV